MSKKTYAIFGIIFLIAACCGWYFLYYTKTPAYSLNIVKDAVQKHDVQKFKKHVDLDSLLNRGIDDFMAVHLKSDPKINNNPFAKGLAGGFVAMLKPVAVNLCKDAIIQSIEGREIGETKPETPQNVNPEQIADKSGVKSIKQEGIVYTKQDGKIATVGINIAQPELPEKFVMDIKMSELDDGTWQIIELSNLREYLIKLEDSRKEALKKYVEETQPIVDKYNQKIKEISASNPEISEKALLLMEQNYADFAAALVKIPVPPAAQELYTLRQEMNKLQKKRFELFHRYLNGDKSQELNIAIKENINQFDLIKNQTRDIKNQYK